MPVISAPQVPRQENHEFPASNKATAYFKKSKTRTKNNPYLTELLRGLKNKSIQEQMFSVSCVDSLLPSLGAVAALSSAILLLGTVRVAGFVCSDSGGH